MKYQKLVKLMNDRNISQRKLAFMADISNQDLNQAINGKKPFFPNWRKRIAAALEVAEAEIFPNEEV